MKTKLIGIVGKKRCGKDTTAEYLIKNNGFERYSFADPIKHGAIAMFGFTEKQMWGSAEDKETVDPRWGISPRRMLQLMGTELFQFDIQKHLKDGEFKVGREVWVKAFKIWYQNEKVKPRITFNVVIADMRFIHEEKAIREMDGEIWRVSRPSLIDIDEHASEKEQDSIVADKTVINDGTLEELYEKIKINLTKDLEISK